MDELSRREKIIVKQIRFHLEADGLNPDDILLRARFKGNVVQVDFRYNPDTELPDSVRGCNVEYWHPGMNQERYQLDG